jgi:hypothetical protein
MRDCTGVTFRILQVLRCYPCACKSLLKMVECNERVLWSLVAPIIAGYPFKPAERFGC